MRILLRTVVASSSRRYTPSCARDSNVLVPLLAADGTAIDLEVNMIILDLHKRDMSGIARFHRWSPQRHCRLQFRGVGCNYPIFQFQSLGPHGKCRAGVDNLSFKIADDLKASLLADT